MTLLPLWKLCRKPNRRRLQIGSGIVIERHRTGDWRCSQPIHQAEDEGSGTMIQPKPCSSAPKVSTATGTSPMASPKPSPPPTPKSAIGSPKPDPPALPAEAADHPMPKALPFKAPPPTLTTTSPRAPPQKSSAPAAAPSTEPAPKIAKKEPPMASAPPPGTGGPQPPAEPPCDHRDTPNGTFSHRERASAGSSPSGAQNCLAFEILDI